MQNRPLVAKRYICWAELIREAVFFGIEWPNFYSIGTSVALGVVEFTQ